MGDTKPYTSESRPRYDQDKYANCLAYYSQVKDEIITPETIKQFEFNKDSTATICVSQKDDLFLMSLSEARSKFYQLLTETMGQTIEHCETGTILTIKLQTITLYASKIHLFLSPFIEKQWNLSSCSGKAY